MSTEGDGWYEVEQSMNEVQCYPYERVKPIRLFVFAVDLCRGVRLAPIALLEP